MYFTVYRSNLQHTFILRFNELISFLFSLISFILSSTDSCSLEASSVKSITFVFFSSKSLASSSKLKMCKFVINNQKTM